MDPHHSAHPSDLTFWSYGPPQTEDSIIWSDIAGNAQPAPQFEQGGSFTDVDWNSANTFQNLAQGGAAPVDLRPTNNAAFHPPYDYSDISLDYTGINLRTSTYLVAQQDFLDPWYAPTPPLTGVDSVTPSPSDAPWPTFSQSPTETTAGTQGVSASHAIARVMLT
ncbi:hypothetical protein BC827DRAFT_1248625 [Russula dissimulans]|nr:hypothetical protein BC827DRAFT_1248625 [Russula dissimulans]